MRCSIQVGDDVVCVTGGAWVRRAPRWQVWRRWVTAAGPLKGELDKVQDVCLAIDPALGEVVMLRLAKWPDRRFCAVNFRKVPRRDLGAWLATGDGVEGPVREKARA